ncbi:MAG: HAD-IA family hydrolase [Bacteroidaceae bacterium]|nr:HAD-IA family hydrolase [Bacteroidaceae bacterium]
MKTDNEVQLPKHVKACIFDFDLTLADGSPWIVACYQEVLHRHGFTQVPDSVVRSTIGLTVEDSFGVMTGKTDADYLWSLRMEYKALCRPRMAEHTKFFPDAERFVKRLSAAGVKCAIVSTKETAVIRHTLQLCGMAEHFALVVGLDEVSAPKPSPEGIEYVLRSLGVGEGEAVYFGDNPVDAEAAERAGVAYVGVAKGVHTAQQLAARPHIGIITDYDDLQMHA